MRRLFVAAVAVLCACAAPEVLPTRSGKPEVTIHADKKAIENAIVSRAVDQGWSLKSSGELSFVIEQQLKSFGAALAFGSDYDSTPDERITFTIIEDSGAVRVVASPDVVTNPGSGYERTTDLSETASVIEPIQQSLDQVKAQLEGRTSAAAHP